MIQSARSIIVVNDAADMAEVAAERLMKRIAGNQERIAVCLTGGSTPKRLYELLATSGWRARIPWARTHWFIGDERFVPADDPDSNIAMARHAFLESCATAGTVHPIPTDRGAPDSAAAAYQTELQAFYGNVTLDPKQPLFDLVLMGVGPDGHTASLFPGYPATCEATRWVVGVPEANATPFVPRVTLTFPTLSSCREMLFLVSGADKRTIVTQVLASKTLPAARAASQYETVWLLDRGAMPEGFRD